MFESNSAASLEKKKLSLLEKLLDQQRMVIEKLASGKMSESMAKRIFDQLAMMYQSFVAAVLNAPVQRQEIQEVLQEEVVLLEQPEEEQEEVIEVVEEPNESEVILEDVVTEDDSEGMIVSDSQEVIEANEENEEINSSEELPVLTETEELHGMALKALPNKESEDASEKILGIVAEYILQTDISGEEDGHIHTTKELVEAALMKLNSELFDMYISNADLQAYVLKNETLQELAENFVSIHMKLSH